jgi:carboxyl-terminal processing protease
MRNIVVGLLLLLAAVGPACAVSSSDDSGNVQPLMTFRAQIPAIAGTKGPMSAYNSDYMVFARVLDRVMAEHVKPQDAGILVERALDGARKAKAEKPAASEAELTEAALHAMMRSLDPYSEYLDAEQYRYFREQTQGEFGGLGIEVAMDEATGFVRVVAPIDGSPAAAAGFKPGDLVTKIDDAPVKGMKLAEAVSRMRGPLGTSVALTVQRTGVNPFRVSLKRSIVQIKSVRSKLEDGNVGYIRIATFNQQTTSGLDNAIADLRKASGDKLRGLVLDLRNNLGGLLDQAVGVSNRFVDKGDIVTVRGRRASDNRHYAATESTVLRQVPIVLLVNSGSASASEIVAGALQDHKRALLMGVRTYGKGSVQTLSPLNDDVGLRLTTARYFRPSNALVDCFGVTPSVEVLAANGNAREMHADPAACDPSAPPPPPVDTLAMEEACPATARATPAKDADVPLLCAAEYLRGNRPQPVTANGRKQAAAR